MTSGVYKITNLITGKYYVGSSYHCKERWKEHLKELKGGYHKNKHLLNSFQKYREENFKFEIIHSLPEKEAREKEQWYIDNFYDDMYNISKLAGGGDLISYHPDRENIIFRMTESVKQRYEVMSESDKEKQWGYLKTKGNPMQGRRHTEESRKKMSQSSVGKPSPNKGKKASAETREKISRAAKQRTGESNPFYGRHHSAETKQYMSEKFKGRIPTNARPVIIDGVEYVSATEAARQLGVVAATILHRIKSSNVKYTGYFYK